MIPKFLYDGSEHDNGDDGCNDGNVEDVYLVSFLHDNESFFFLTGIHSMQGWTATTRHGVTRKRNTKRLRRTGNLFRKNLPLKDVC